MAYFYNYDIPNGWWFYFHLRYVIEVPEFRAEFMEELAHLIKREGNDDIGKNDKKQERIQVHKVRGYIN